MQYLEAGRRVWAKRLTSIAFGLTLLCGFAYAQEAPAGANKEDESAQSISWGRETDYNGKYVWRGLACSRGSVVQPSLWVSARGTTYTVWANGNLQSKDGRQLNEVDHYLSWEGTWHKASIEPCLYVSTYPNQQDSPSTANADVKLSWPVGRLSLFTTQSFDVGKYFGAYYGDAGLCFPKKLSKCADLESSISLGWASPKFNETYIGPRISSLNVGIFEISATYRNRRGDYFRPHLTISRLLNDALRSAVEQPNIVNFGLAVGKEF
jgi:hypothetical protein